jgi:glycerophosphoryl diester phosphodiesterase
MINYCKDMCENTVGRAVCVSGDSSGFKYQRCRHAVLDGVSAGAGCKVVAHRGFSSLAPENTLASVAASIAASADACEFDVRCTADGHVVLMHDATVDRTTNGSGEVADMTLAEAQLLDAGAWKGREYVGEVIPSLADVFELMAPSGQLAVVEIKANEAAEGIARLAREYSMVERVVALSDDPVTLGEIAAVEPNIRRALLCTAFPGDVKTAGRQIEWLVDEARKGEADVVDIDYRFVSPEMIATLGRNGIEVWVWTVNAVEIMKCLIDWGIDAIASDKPDLLKATVNRVG